MNATSVSPIRLGIIGCFLLLSYLALFPSWPEDFGLKSKPPSQDFCTPLPADRPVPPDTLTQPLGHNRLHLGQTAPEGRTKISILPAEEFDGWTRAQVLERRIAEVNKHSSLLVNSYAPAREIFGQIVDGRPWWGTLGQFLLYSYDGKPQTDSIVGPSEESRQILNPFVLLWPELHSVWYLLQATGPRAHILENGTFNQSDFPVIPYPYEVRWNARESSADLFINLSKYRESVLRYIPDLPDPVGGWEDRIGLNNYNARDFGLPFIYPVQERSTNTKMYCGRGSGYPGEITEFLHCGGSCQQPGGCNNMSGNMGETGCQVALTGLPASVTYFLWKSKPTEPVNPDFTYRIHFE